MLIQLGAVLRARDTAVSAVRPGSVRESVEKQLRASERRGAKARKELQREVDRRREQMARLTRRVHRQVTP
jgi:hypothetical protein